MSVYDLIGGRALKLSLFGLGFWNLIIPAITSLAGLFHHGDKHPSYVQDQVSGVERQIQDSTNPSGAGGWGAAAPWLLGGAAGALGGYLAGRHNNSSGSGNAILDQLMQMQLARSQQAEPLRQLLLNSAFGRLPVYQQEDPAGQAWQRNYAASAASAMLPPGQSPITRKVYPS